MIQHQPKIVINYVPPFNQKTSVLPQIKFQKLLVFQPQAYSMTQAEILLKIETDGEKAISIELIESYNNPYNDNPNETDIQLFAEFAIENIKTWRFWDHTPTNFSMLWKYILSEAVDEKYHDTFKIDTTKLNSLSTVEIVKHYKPNILAAIERNSNSDNNSSNNLPQMDYLHIPVPIENQPLYGRDEIIINVKTDGENVISAKAIKYRTPALRDVAIENIKTWRFKKHTPAEFITHWVFCSEYIPPRKFNSVYVPNHSAVTLELPQKIEVILFHNSDIDPVATGFKGFIYRLFRKRP
jgi:hypothetical protein